MSNDTTPTAAESAAQEVADLQAIIARIETGMEGMEDADAVAHGRDIIRSHRAHIAIIREQAGLPITTENTRPTKSPAKPDCDTISETWRPGVMSYSYEEKRRVLRVTKLIEHRGHYWYSQSCEYYTAKREKGSTDERTFWRYTGGYADGLGIEHF